MQLIHGDGPSVPGWEKDQSLLTPSEVAAIQDYNDSITKERLTLEMSQRSGRNIDAGNRPIEE